LTVVRFIINNFADRKKWVKAEHEFVNLFRSPGVDSQPAWLADTTSLFDVPALGLLERLQIRAQFCVPFPVCKLRKKAQNNLGPGGGVFYSIL
jgi:hypothetical protein